MHNFDGKTLASTGVFRHFCLETPVFTMVLPIGGTRTLTLGEASTLGTHSALAKHLG
jgi:hypothetical protein